MSFGFLIDFMFLVLEPCEALRTQRKLTVQLEQHFSFPFSLFIFVSVVLTRMASPGEERGTGYGAGGVSVTSIVAETDSERRVSYLVR
jgi:hypothetical protein